VPLSAILFTDKTPEKSEEWIRELEKKEKAE